MIDVLDWVFNGLEWFRDVFLGFRDMRMKENPWGCWRCCCNSHIWLSAWTEEIGCLWRCGWRLSLVTVRRSSTRYYIAKNWIAPDMRSYIVGSWLLTGWSMQSRDRCMQTYVHPPNLITAGAIQSHWALTAVEAYFSEQPSPANSGIIRSNRSCSETWISNHSSYTLTIKSTW